MSADAAIEAHADNVREALDWVGTEISQIARAASLIRAAQASGGWLMTAGNGGSAAIAMHMAGDLRKSLGYRALCLTDNVTALTALANDADYSQALAGQYHALRAQDPGTHRAHDAVLIISCSGASPNVVALAAAAHGGKSSVITITGKSPGAPARLHSDCEIVVPSLDYEVIEDVAQVVCHAIKRALMERGA